MQRQYYTLNPQIMTASQLRSDLLLQIEQADEKLLRIIDSVVKAVKTEYTDSTISDEELADLRTPKMTVEEYEASLKPMTVEELIARAEASNEDIAAGRVYSLEQVEKMFGI